MARRGRLFEGGPVGDTFQAFVDWLSHYGYPVLFLVVFAENTGLPVPGETAVLISGMLSSHENPPMSIYGVIGVTFFAAVLGDNMGFWLGRRWARPRLEQGKRFLFLTPTGLRSVEGYFEHYGLLTIFFARFVAGLRVVAALAAGTSQLTWPRFLMANAGGAVAWSVTMGLLGHFFGRSWDLLHKWMGRSALIILACAVLLIGLPYLWRRIRQLPTGSWDRLLRNQVWQGALAAVGVVVCVAVLLILGERHEEGAEDTRISTWVSGHPSAWLAAVAVVGSAMGTLPVLVVLTVLSVIWLWATGRPWREWAALLWAFLASEGLGLLLLGLLRHRGLEPPRALAWPFGYVGLEPLRAAAVYGMLAHVYRLQGAPGTRLVWGLAIILILLVGFSSIWSEAQFLTEILVEYVVGLIVLLSGFWWLEGYGLGPRAGPAAATGPSP